MKTIRIRPSQAARMLAVGIAFLSSCERRNPTTIGSRDPLGEGAGEGAPGGGRLEVWGFYLNLNVAYKLNVIAVNVSDKPCLVFLDGWETDYDEGKSSLSMTNRLSCDAAPCIPDQRELQRKCPRFLQPGESFIISSENEIATIDGLKIGVDFSEFYFDGKLSFSGHVFASKIIQGAYQKPIKNADNSITVRLEDGTAYEVKNGAAVNIRQE